MRPAETALEGLASQPSHQAMTQAAEWYALLRSGDATAEDRMRWRNWLDAAAEHRQAWGYVERIGRRFQPLQASPDRRAAVQAFREASGGPARRRRQVLLGLAAAGGAGWLGWTAWREGPLPMMAASWMADYRAGLGETRRIVLADGTQVWLKALGAFDADYGLALRRLRLVAGEMLVNTGADAARPFVVETGEGRLRALGTRFAVRQEDGAVLVAVYEGAVEATTAITGRTAVVPAGRQLRFTGTRLEASAPASPAREAWTRGVLVADGITLAEVVQELRGHHYGYLGVAPEAAGLPVFGSYPAEDVDRALEMLASVMPIRVRRPLRWWVSIEPLGP